MKNIELSIPSMQSAHCQTRVSDAIKNINGLTIAKTEAGMITFSVENEEAETMAITAIEKAGYKVDQPSDCVTGCCGN